MTISHSIRTELVTELIQYRYVEGVKQNKPCMNFIHVGLVTLCHIVTY